MPHLTESNNLLSSFGFPTFMTLKLINPESLGAPRGYSNGVLADAGGRLLFVAGQIGWDEKQTITSDSFAEQFDRALANVIAVVAEADGTPNRSRASSSMSPTRRNTMTV